MAKRYLGFLFLVFILAAQAKASLGYWPYYNVTLSTDKTEYALGEPVVVTVCYHNGYYRTWHLHTNDYSKSCTLSYRNGFWNNSDWNKITFNQLNFINTRENCVSCSFGMTLSKERVSIKPNEYLSFKIDLLGETPVLENIIPGKYSLQYADNFEKIYSDTLKVCIKFTYQSIGYILKTITSEKQTPRNIQWGIKLLKNIYPEIANYKYSVDSRGNAYYTSYQKKQNTFLINRFKNYCEHNKSTKGMYYKIMKINSDFSSYAFVNRNNVTVKNTCF